MNSLFTNDGVGSVKANEGKMMFIRRCSKCGCGCLLLLLMSDDMNSKEWLCMRIVSSF